MFYNNLYFSAIEKPWIFGLSITKMHGFNKTETDTGTTI